MRRVQGLRGVEERIIWRSLMMLSTLEALIFFAPGVATFIILVTRHAMDGGFGSDSDFGSGDDGANQSDGGSFNGDGHVGGSGLHVEEAYAVLGLCNVLVKQLNVFPRAVKTFDEARVSFRRVEAFLLLPEASTTATISSAPREAAQQAGEDEQTGTRAETLARVAPAGKTEKTEDVDMVVHVDGVTARWGLSDCEGTAGATPVQATATAAHAMAGDVGPFALRGISMTVRRGEVCVIVGEVGCGKSSLLQMLLGEMLLPAVGRGEGLRGEALSGEGRIGAGGSNVVLHVRREGGIGYVPQQAWIVNATVRQNIVLGREPFDEAWYQKIVAACALGPDLASFSQGDATQIGERGVTVSGGQKARIALARALRQAGAAAPRRSTERR